MWAMLSGVSEPIAALLGYAVLANAMGPTTFGTHIHTHTQTHKYTHTHTHIHLHAYT
jgi:hypothetical protein